MKKIKTVILDGYTENPGDLNWSYLEDTCDLTVYERTSGELIVERAKDAEIVILNKVPLSRATIDMLPNLRFVALLSTGYNVVDCDYLRSKNIPVSNIPAYSTQAVAQIVFSFLLHFSNRIADYNDSVKNGDWVACPDFCYLKYPVFELSGKTLGIIGFGKIGSTVAKIASTFGMNVIAFTPSGKKDGVDYALFTSLDRVLKEADFLSLHCPLSDATNKLVNAEFIDKMKTRAYLINTSRGAVIDEHAVALALKSGKLAGFGADVLSTEPPLVTNPLLFSPNTVLTPHIAWAGYETRMRLLNMLNGNIEAYLNGTPRNVVN
ncbi:MAG: Glycerate dehydrogenase [Firmicutes bacterium ADurb.Bin300]|nr:MAG: Glycerate dehydrogenase [Firmicutes bacterium ADurb.Bin300]